MHLVHQDHINAQLFKGNGPLAAGPHGLLLDGFNDAVTSLHQLLGRDRTQLLELFLVIEHLGIQLYAILVGGGVGLFFQGANILLGHLHQGFFSEAQTVNQRMGEDHGIPVIIRNLAHLHRDGGRTQVVHIQHLGCWVHHLNLMCHAGTVGVVRQDQRLFGNSIAARLHRNTTHGECLASSHLMRIDRALVDQCTPDGIGLVLAQIEWAIAKLQGHALKAQERPVELRCGVGIARFVVFRFQVRAALWVRPQPFCELGTNFTDTRIGLCCGLKVHVLMTVAVLALDLYRLICQRGIHQLAEFVVLGAKARARLCRMVGARRQTGLPAAIGEAHLNVIAVRAVEHVCDVVCIHLGRNPCRAQLAFNVEVRNVCWHNLFQLSHVTPHGLVALGQRRLGLAQLMAHVARQVNVGRNNVTCRRFKHGPRLNQSALDLCFWFACQLGNFLQCGRHGLVTCQDISILWRWIGQLDRTAHGAGTQDGRRLAIDRERGQRWIKRVINAAQVLQAPAVAQHPMLFLKSLKGGAQRGALFFSIPRMFSLNQLRI